ncbi:MAG: hypothetical protein JST81_03035 [Bacteroidetes bacterium]|nr:hypothetical protein [Bacteroidota bacterium]
MKHSSVLFLVIFISCVQHKNVDLVKNKWARLDTAGIYAFIQSADSTKRSGTGNAVSLQIIGTLWPGTDKIDSSANASDMLSTTIQEDLYASGLQDYLPRNSVGYIKVNLQKFLMKRYLNDRHFSIFIKNKYSPDSLLRDSAMLAATTLFSKIYIFTPEQGISEYEKTNGGDTGWRKFLTENPLPYKIECRLKPDYLNRNAFDSTEKMLATRFPQAEIIPGFLREILHGQVVINAEALFSYKFN